jgi:hypothetical protein
MCLYQHTIKSIKIIVKLEMRHTLFGLASIFIGCVAFASLPMVDVNYPVDLATKHPQTVLLDIRQSNCQKVELQNRLHSPHGGRLYEMGDRF